MAKGCALSTGYLLRGGLLRNSVVRITDHPEMTSAVDCGRKASTQTNKQTNKQTGMPPRAPIVKLLDINYQQIIYVITEGYRH